MNCNVAETRPDAQTLATDLIWGIDGIAEVIGRTPRQTHYLLERRLLPATKVGGRYMSSHTALNKHFTDLLAAEQA